MALLESIVDAKRREVERLKTAPALRSVRRGLIDAPPVRPFDLALVREDGNVAVIAEIKRRSPSRGHLNKDLDPAAVAATYESGGASALSVLTDDEFFGGSIEDLRIARSSIELPVLRKDFTIDPVQVEEARAAGADAVLLIVATVTDDGLLKELHACAREAGMTAIVEIGNEVDLERALSIEPHVVGINNRNLRTLEELHEPLDITTGERLISQLPASVIAVAMSGIHSAADATLMAKAGCHAILVGEYLVTARNAEIMESSVRELSSVRRVTTPEFV
jgi:indole-3-glycerol phosphate synthase